MKIIILCLSLILHSSYTVKVQNTLTTQLPQSRMAILANTVLNSVKVNQVPISFSGRTDLSNPAAAKIFPYAFKIGDEIEIDVSTTNNNIGVMASFFFTNGAGQQLVQSTDATWTCNDKSVRILKNNNGGYAPINTAFPIDALSIWDYDDKVKSVICKGKIKQFKSYGTIDVVFDDYLDRLYVNDIPQQLPIIKNDPLALRSINAILGTGDRVKICGRNASSNIIQDPASLLATIRFINNEGNIQEVNTDEETICNGKEATVLGSNQDPTTFWFRQRGHSVNGINPSAKYVWAEDKKSLVCCEITLKKPRREAKMNLVLDNKLVDLKINGKTVHFPVDPKEIWLEPKFFSVELRSQDTIEFYIQRNGVEQPFIIATIYYFDNFGKPAEVNTGGSFKCDGETATIINKPAIAQYCPDVSPKAKWITTSRSPAPDIMKCSVTLK